MSLNPSKRLSFSSLVYHKQLSKLNNPTIHLPNNVILSPIDSARNLGVIFDKNLSFAQHISSISKSCFLNIRDLRRIVILLIKLLHAPLLLLSFILKLTSTQSIYYTNESSSTCPLLSLLPVLSPKLLNFITLLLFLNLYIGSR